ncbi:MAG TPA: lipoyl domain-containing protein [Sphingopyxis sp.]|nr:lipoyl domain-containing protein [Sphingopyxis sp.]HMP44678.1 lipoyl domain-containing protein [Sphingopyxis sp.]HMQ18139.1 lipoyl domain-containing protein [Sphingopyxis sp.]
MTDVTVPAGLWSADDEAAISAWLYADGDSVPAGAVIAEIMVEKSSFELIAPASGVLRIAVAAEIPVAQGAIVARIG